MAEDVGPEKFGKLRATPEFKPFTDFDNYILANERTDRLMPGDGEKPNQCWAIVDQAFFFSSRGWRLRFKTEAGGDTLFNITRRGPPIMFYFTFLITAIAGMLSSRAGESCTCGSPEKGCTVKAEDNKTIIGYVRPSVNRRCGPHGIFRNRFWKQPKPYYDIFDANQNLKYQIVLPVQKSMFLGCELWFDKDYFAIVNAERKDEWCTKANDYAVPEAEGWIIPMRPLFQDSIDKCLARCNSFKKCCGPIFGFVEMIVQIFVAFVG